MVQRSHARSAYQLYKYIYMRNEQRASPQKPQSAEEKLVRMRLTASCWCTVGNAEIACLKKKKKKWQCKCVF